MREHLKFYIDGKWVEPAGQARTHDVINPATEEPCARISLGSKADVDKAVAAARRAFETYSQTTKEERLALLGRILKGLQARQEDFAAAVSEEMGAPMWLAKMAQAPAALGHFMEIIRVLKDYEFAKKVQGVHIEREPIGVCGLITPWNWPINQIACKVAPALAAGCTMVLKPSEMAPVNAIIFAEVMDEAGCPPGVFNLVNGDGPGVGAIMSAHPDIDMMSFTGSTRAGILISKAAADTVKRVALELGGKSANIILDDADLKKAVSTGVHQMFGNSGQSCNAPSRMLVPRKLQGEIVELAKAAAAKAPVMAPNNEVRGSIGPLANANQFQKVQALIQKGVDEKATVVTGGPGRPEGFNRGYYVKPTIFSDVTNDMTIAREEIFGPVLVIMPYDTETEAVKIANDSVYGLSSYVQTGSIERGRKIAKQMRAGDARINTMGPEMRAPFGGYKQSGIGREWGEFGLEEYLEVKAVLGYDEPVKA